MTLETSFSPFGNNKLNAGIDYKYGKIHLRDNYQRNTRKSEANGVQHLASLFIQDEMKFLKERLIATFGLRGDYCKSLKGWVFDTGQTFPLVNSFSYDYNERDWISISPKASFVYHLSDGPNGGQTYRRQVAVDKMYFNGDGTIKPIVRTNGLRF